MPDLSQTPVCVDALILSTKMWFTIAVRPSSSAIAPSMCCCLAWSWDKETAFAGHWTRVVADANVFDAAERATATEWDPRPTGRVNANVALYGGTRHAVEVDFAGKRQTLTKQRCMAYSSKNQCWDFDDKGRRRRRGRTVDNPMWGAYLWKLPEYPNAATDVHSLFQRHASSVLQRLPHKHAAQGARDRLLAVDIILFKWYLGDVVYSNVKVKKKEHVIVDCVVYYDPPPAYAKEWFMMRDKLNTAKMINQIVEYEPRNQGDKGRWISRWQRGTKKKIL